MKPTAFNEDAQLSKCLGPGKDDSLIKVKCGTCLKVLIFNYCAEAEYYSPHPLKKPTKIIFQPKLLPKEILEWAGGADFQTRSSASKTRFTSRK